MIFTFYSFKGGVGRSMAVANIAELFYARGLKVLMVDFDLEAPGLERYFDVTGSATPSSEIPGQRGVIDVILSFLELQSFAPKQPPTASADAGSQAAFPFSVEPLSNFIVPIYSDPSRPGKLSLMPSGNRRKPDFAAYAKRVLDLDWGAFYTQKDGEQFFEWFRLELLREWDLVLIDSRTGVTELGGVCTHHLADAVASFVATNLQNLEGTAMMARSLSNPDLVSKGRKGRSLQQLFIPSRVELSEEDKHDDFAARFNRELGGFFPTNQTPEQTWFLDLRLLYVAAYSYMERVAVREPERASKADLIQAYGRLAALMAKMAGTGPLLEAWAPASRTLSNLPSRNPYFIGREEDLKRIRALFSNGSPVAICGLAGMGKTSLAIEYAYRYRSEYTTILFCRAESEEELRHGCQAIASLLALPTGGVAPRDAVRAWLERNQGWLLILDGAKDAELTRRILPFSIAGHVLYTTRSQQVSALGAQPVSIESMSREAAIGFFEKRLGRQDLGDPERAAVAEFVDEVGALPLALEQAAAYVTNRKTRIQDYVASFRRRRLGLLDQQSAMSAGREISVSAALEPTLEEIDKIPASADVLRVAAFLASDPIPTALLTTGAKHLGSAISSALADAKEDPLALDEVLDPLTRFSLIDRDRDSQTFSVHKLVSDMVRARVPDRTIWQDSITLALLATFSEPNLQNIPLGAALISHVLAALEWSNTVQLRIRAGQYLLLRGEYVKAEQCLRAIGPNRSLPEQIIALRLRAQACLAQSRFGDAIELLESAIHLSRQASPGAEIGAGLSLETAAAYAANGRLEQAGQLYANALEQSRMHADLKNMVLALCGLAGTMLTKSPEEGINMAEEALLYAQKLGLDSQSMALGALADALIAAGRATEPRTMEVVMSALSVGEAVYGAEHPALAGALRRYAIVLHAHNREDEAKVVFQRAQSIIELSMGPQSTTATNFRTDFERQLAALQESKPAAQPKLHWAE